MIGRVVYVLLVLVCLGIAYRHTHGSAWFCLVLLFVAREVDEYYMRKFNNELAAILKDLILGRPVQFRQSRQRTK